MIVKIKIHLLPSALFWGYPQILDLDTGQIYTSPLQDEEIKQLKRSRLLPHYSEAKIYQDYLQIIHDRFGVPLEDWFYQYPKFEFDLNSIPENFGEFFHKAHVVCEEFWPNEYDPSFPDFGTYLSDCTLQFAKDWCEKEGYEWYDNWQKREDQP